MTTRLRPTFAPAHCARCKALTRHVVSDGYGTCTVCQTMREAPEGEEW